MLKVFKILIICISITLVNYSFNCFGDNNNNKEKYETEKIACISGFNLSEKEAKDNLLHYAKRSAIEELFGELIKSEVIIKNSVLDKDIIESQSMGLIRIKGDPTFYQGKNFGEVCVKINSYTTDSDVDKFKLKKATKKSCAVDGDLKVKAKNDAMIGIITDFAPQLTFYQTSELIHLLHNVNIMKEEYIENHNVYCVTLEAQFYPIELLGFKPKVVPKTPKPKTPFFYYEDFESIEEGLVPKSWYCGDELLTKYDVNETVFTTSVQKNDHTFTISNVQFPDNFKLNIYANVGHDADLIIKLSENIFGFKHTGNQNIRYNINSSQVQIQENFVAQRTKYSIEKKGSVFKLYVNDIKKIIGRLSKFSTPEGIIVNILESNYGFKIYKIEGEFL